MTTVARYRIHQMIQDLNRDPARAADFARDHDPEFDRYGLTDAERAALRDGSRQALIGLGVHPNLQMKFGRLRRPKPPGGHSMEAAYLDRLTKVD